MKINFNLLTKCLHLIKIWPQRIEINKSAYYTMIIFDMIRIRSYSLHKHIKKHKTHTHTHTYTHTRTGTCINGFGNDPTRVWFFSGSGVPLEEFDRNSDHVQLIGLMRIVCQATVVAAFPSLSLFFFFLFHFVGLISTDAFPYRRGCKKENVCRI